MVLVAEWAQRASRLAPSVATVDHGLRPEAAQEAIYVARIAAKCGLSHTLLKWSGHKPKTGLQKAARNARYDLLSGHARSIGADAVLLAHQAEDQAETVLMRLCAGSGVAGLRGMDQKVEWQGVTFLRPLLDVSRARLAATLAEKAIEPVNDSSNTDPRYTRVRFRNASAFLAEEGLDTGRLSTLSRRMARADEALTRAADAARLANSLPASEGFRFAPSLWDEPDEIVIRLLSGALALGQHDQRIDLGGVEAVFDALIEARKACKATRRNVGGMALSVASDGVVTIKPETPRRVKPKG
jgi:tRNA(Ile)-lysidine synthase